MSTPLFNFSPRWPLSGDVFQDYKPETQWFFGAIAPSAGVAPLEQHIALDVASYGKQLSALFDVVQALLKTDLRRHFPKEAGQALDDFERLAQRIDAAKKDRRADYRVAAKDALARLKVTDAPAYAALVEEIARAAEAGGKSARRPR